MPPVQIKPTIPAGERPQTYALDRAATGTGSSRKEKKKNFYKRLFQPTYLFTYK
jgi:hypothetical protein